MSHFGLIAAKLFILSGIWMIFWTYYFEKKKQPVNEKSLAVVLLPAFLLIGYVLLFVW